MKRKRSPLVLSPQRFGSTGEFLEEPDNNALHILHWVAVLSFRDKVTNLDM